MFRNQTEIPNSYIPRLYIPTPWEPEQMLDHDNMEHALELLVSKAATKLSKYHHYNLSPNQRQCLRDLAARDDLIMYPTDENLGPCIVERNKYILQVLLEHLTNTINYTMLPTEMVAAKLKQQRSNFLAIYEKFHREIQTPAERTYSHVHLMIQPWTHTEYLNSKELTKYISLAHQKCDQLSVALTLYWKSFRNGLTTGSRNVLQHWFQLTLNIPWISSIHYI
jgi:hypothetical protein